MTYANMVNVPTQTAGTSEILASDWNTYVRDNFNDLKAGHIVCTSSTRPSTGLVEGVMIYETDTDRVLVYSGSDWRLVSGKVPSVQVRRTANISPYTNNAVIDWSGTKYISDSSMWSSGAAGKIIVPLAGVYLISFYIRTNSTATMNYAFPTIQVGGNTIYYQQLPIYNTLNNVYGSATTLESLSANAEIQLLVDTDTTGTRAILGDTDAGIVYQQTRCTVHWMGNSAW